MTHSRHAPHADDTCRTPRRLCPTLADDDRRPARAPPRQHAQRAARARSGCTSPSRVLTTAYPSELGHAARRAHGANKPPRLMARLIEFFSRTGELVLDPFAGVGGTLLGAAIARGPRRALGIELEPRWASVYERVVRDLAGERDGAGPGPRRPRHGRPGRAARLRSVRAASCGVGDALAVLPTHRRRLGRLRRDRPAVQRPAAADDGRRRAGRDAREPADRLRDGHRFTRRPRQRPRLRRPSSTGWATVFGELAARPARRALRGGHRPRRLPGRPLRVHRLRTSRRARPRSGLVPEGRPDLVPGRDAAAAVRLSARVRPEHRPPAHPGAAQGTGSRSGRGADATAR